MGTVKQFLLCLYIPIKRFIVNMILFKNWVLRTLRLHGIIHDDYLEIKKYKNLYLGNRCFIVATGPSLTISDLDLIRNEISFSMNSICKLYDKTEYRPSFYGIQDEKVYPIIMKEITYNYDGPVFVSNCIAEKYDIPSSWIKFELNYLYHGVDLWYEKKYYVKFSDDVHKVVYDGYSITYSLLQIAIYMGFKEIYLLGCDCSYNGGEKNRLATYGKVDRNANKAKDRMLVGYQKIKSYADANNISVINCTRGGVLEVFDRKPLEEVLRIEKTITE